MSLQEFYNSINVNPTEVLHRFGNNEMMLTKFLKKFLEDNTFLELSQAVENRNWEDTFRAAHTLKGLCGNFDFKELFELSSKIVEKYREQNYDAIPELFEKLMASYQITVDNLVKFLE